MTKVFLNQNNKAVIMFNEGTVLTTYFLLVRPASPHRLCHLVKEVLNIDFKFPTGA
jgi:hypothetical protein